MSNVCFDIIADIVFGNNVAGFGNNVERNFLLSTKSKQIEHVQFVSALLTKPATLLPKNGNNVEATFNFVERIVHLVAFDIVASCITTVFAELHMIGLTIICLIGISSHVLTRLNLILRR